jgi:hypothetical protein
MGFLSSLFGGDSSSSSTSSTSNATNTAYETDKRAVASDNAISLTGDNNTIDRSTSNLTQFFDASNRSTTNTTSFMDNSDRSTTNVTNVTDYGSVSGALALSGNMTTKALDVAGDGIKGAIDVLKLESNNGLELASKAFAAAASSGANALGTSAQVLGFAHDAIAQTADAFATAKDSGQSKMVMAALAAIAVVGVAFALRK